ncbi:MAG: fatty acid desaturase [Elusimicrobia bacterium]|nr:fatty acid desaturase [Elusimicrobiota bacterium]
MAHFDPYQPYRSRLLTMEEIKRLSVLRPGRLVLDTALCWLAILAAWTVVALRPAWWTALAAVPVIGSRYYALFILGHDGMHRRLLDRIPDNDLYCDLLLLGPIGAITRLNNKNHLYHHIYLADDRDPDRHKHCCANKADAFAFAGFLTGLTSVGRSAANVFLRSQAAAKTDGYGLRDFLILAAWQGALIAGLSAAIGWWAYPVLWLAPVYVFMFLADNVRSFAEHSQPEADSRADRHRLITYRSNALERLFLAPLNMNLHVAHHLFPSVPYYNLPPADALMRERGPLEGLEWRESYLGYLWRYFRSLPLPECRRELARMGLSRP